jgi:hypothetical protein
MSLKISPPLGGRGSRGGGTNRSLFCPPPPVPSPIEGGGDYLGNFKYNWLEFTWSLEFGYWNLARIGVVLSNRLL